MLVLCKMPALTSRHPVLTSAQNEGSQGSRHAASSTHHLTCPPAHKLSHKQPPQQVVSETGGKQTCVTSIVQSNLVRDLGCKQTQEQEQRPDKQHRKLLPQTTHITLPRSYALGHPAGPCDSSHKQAIVATSRTRQAQCTCAKRTTRRLCQLCMLAITQATIHHSPFHAQLHQHAHHKFSKAVCTVEVRQQVTSAEPQRQVVQRHLKHSWVELVRKTTQRET